MEINSKGCIAWVYECWSKSRTRVDSRIEDILLPSPQLLRVWNGHTSWNWLGSNMMFSFSLDLFASFCPSIVDLLLPFGRGLFPYSRSFAERGKQEGTHAEREFAKHILTMTFF